MTPMQVTVGAVARTGAGGNAYGSEQTCREIARIVQLAGKKRRSRCGPVVQPGGVDVMTVKSAVLACLAVDKALDTVPEPQGNDMSRLLIALFISAGLGFAGSVVAQTAAAPLSKESYAAAKTSADAQYKSDTTVCASLSGNAKDICTAEAKGKEKVAKADATAAYENTPKAREKARVAFAQANYGVAIEKCDDQAGNPKDVCVKQAKAELVKGKANAKVDRVTADTRHDASTKQAEARKEANTEKRDADYKVAIEKCDALAGSAKDVCVGNAKVQYGKA